MIGFKNLEEFDNGFITRLDDKRLVKIDPQEKGFFDSVLNFNEFENGTTKFMSNIYKFQVAIKKVKDSNLSPFYKSIFDPSEYENTIGFKSNCEPAMRHTFEWWRECILKLPEVEGRKWRLANELEYYAFMTWLINKAVKSGDSVITALRKVIDDSSSLGFYHNPKMNQLDMVDFRMRYKHISFAAAVKESGFDGIKEYYDLKEMEKYLEEEGRDYLLTGSMNKYGVCDLANVRKIVSSSENENTFYLASGSSGSKSTEYPLANLDEYTYIPNEGPGDFCKFSVAFLIL